MLIVFDANCQLHYSESYTGTASINYNTGLSILFFLQRAFGSLISEDYKNFILTVGCTAVAIYRKGDMGFKTFDSHARYL